MERLFTGIGWLEYTGDRSGLRGWKTYLVQRSDKTLVGTKRVLVRIVVSRGSVDSFLRSGAQELKYGQLLSP